MSESGTQFSDLKTRLISAGVLVFVGVFALWLGGGWFLMLVAVVTALMVWELARMLSPSLDLFNTAMLSLGAWAAIIAANLFERGYILPVLLVPVLTGLFLLKTNRTLYFAYAVLILTAGFSLSAQRDLGSVWVIWLIMVVIVTDVAGYFAGRLIGGPKFWPKVSPKKTWSGTVAGWIAAIFVGLVFAGWTHLWAEMIVISVLLSFASQMGDVAESAIKRKMGVKDTSNLIPGHGGFMDRFDGMIGASVALLLIELIFRFPFGAGHP